MLNVRANIDGKIGHRRLIAQGLSVFTFGMTISRRQIQKKSLTTHQPVPHQPIDFSKVSAIKTKRSWVRRPQPVPKKTIEIHQEVSTY